MLPPGETSDPSTPSEGESETDEAEAAPAAVAVQSCASCATLLDVSDQEPLARIHCPVCGAGMNVHRQFSNFSVVEKLGQGGMGAVYKALDVNLNRMVALKLLRRELGADPEYIAKLEDEAKITASISHPYVVRVFSFGDDQGQYYLAMELVDKGSLDDLMDLQGRVAESQVLEVGRQVAEGLRAAHERGLIHRDVKPGNILFADAHTAKITDFGLALLAEREAESRGEIWGTPYYIAPEKLNHEPEDLRSDIYSLGGTLFHAVAGRPPFEAENASLVALKHLKSQAVSLQAFAPDVSNETAYVVNRMLNKDPSQRYDSYDELIEHLQYAADTLSERTSRPRVAKQRVEVESEETRSIAGMLTLLLIIVLMIGGGLAYAFRNRVFQPALNPQTDLVLQARKAEEQRRKADAQTVEQAYQEARHLLMNEQFASAQDAFGQLVHRSGLTRPLADWARLHQGVSALLNRQMDDSQTAFTAESKAGFFSREAVDLPLAGFFNQTASFMAGAERPVSAGAAQKFDNRTVEDFSLLAFGLKDWELGAVDDAAKLLTAYAGGEPAAPYRWIADYRPLAEKRLHDYKLYAGLRDRLQAVKTAADQQSLLKDFADVRGKLQTTGKIVELLDRDEAVLQAKLSATQLQESSNSLASDAAVNDRDKGVWQAAHETARRASQDYRFDQAVATLEGAKLHGEDFMRARDLALARARSLAGFKQMIISDVNSQGGYPEPLTSRNNTVFPNGIQAASEDELQFATPYGGDVKLQWNNFEPKVLLRIAAYFADRTADVKKAAALRWAAAMFAQEFGLNADALALAQRAAKDRPEYSSDMAQFSNSATPAH